MKNILLVGLVLVSCASHADERIDQLCQGRDIKKPAACAQVISEQLDAAYVWGEQNAHLIKKQKLVKRQEFINSEPMMNLCRVAPDAKRCELFRTYLIEEYDAGIGLY